MDEFLRIGLGLPQGDNNYDNSTFEIHGPDPGIIGEELTLTVPGYTDTVVQYDAQFYKVLLVTFFKFILSCLGKLHHCNTEINSHITSLVLLMWVHDRE
jgi:hypothetical protein